jgi:hypothetical protein
VLRPTDRLAAAPCVAHLYRDGEPLAVHELAHTSDREVRLALDLEALRGLQDSQRLAGDACGRPVALGDVARCTLSEFEVRFREERAKHGAPLATGRD